MLKKLQQFGRLNRFSPKRERGVVLLIALIVLVAMTLAGIALVRSVDTTNIIAGNLSFQQAATHSADIGIETAINWLENNNAGALLDVNNTGQGYLASRQDPAAGQSWDAFWTAVLQANAVTLPTDAAGNTASYVIQRMCNAVGPSTTPATGCAVSPVVSSSTANSSDAGSIELQFTGQVYYRITTRVVGPRNSVSYVQAIVTM